MFTALAGIGIPTQQEYDQIYGGGITVGVAPAPPRTAADLKRLIQASGGSLFVWTSSASQSPELRIVRGNPLTFKATPVADDPGTYRITLATVASLLPALKPGTGEPGAGAGAPIVAGASSLSSYVPYLVIGGGALLVLSMLKR